MGWAKFDDQFTDHPKVVAAGPMAELLAMRAVIHCARYETDGHVQAAQLPKLGLGITSPRKQVAALVAQGLWEEDPDGDGWWVHDFLEYHPSRADKDEEREKARERMAKARANKTKRSLRSSQDVRANTQENNGRSSGNPDPAPPQVPNGTLSGDAPRRKPRAPDPIFDAVIDACGLDPGELTKSARGAANNAVKQLKDVGATPDGIRARADVHRQRWPNAECTPSSLAKNYAQLGTAKSPPGPTPLPARDTDWTAGWDGRIAQ